MILLLRGLAIIVGLGAIAAVTYGTVEATGGIGANSAPLYIALGGLQAVIAMSFGIMHSRIGKAVAILVLVACEAATFIGTADLQLAGIETRAAPVHEAAAKRKAAEDWVARLERDDRVEKALQAAKEARADANARSTDKGCGPSCKATLAKSVDDATAAIEQARASLQLEQRQARAALASAPLPGSPSPLADRLGVRASTLDLVFVGFRGFAVAAGAAILLAIGAHPGRRQAALVPETSSTTKKREDLPAPRKIARFMVESIEAAPRSRIEIGALYAAYCAWCKSNGVCALPAPQFGDALVPVLNEVGIERKARGDDVFLVGVRLAS